MMDVQRYLNVVLGNNDGFDDLDEFDLSEFWDESHQALSQVFEGDNLFKLIPLSDGDKDDDAEFCKEYSLYPKQIADRLKVQEVASSLSSNGDEFSTERIPRPGQPLSWPAVSFFAEISNREIALLIAITQYNEGKVTRDSQWPMTYGQFKSAFRTSRTAILQRDKTAKQIRIARESGSQSMSLAERMSSFITAYDNITVIATLVFSFAVSLAASYAKEDHFAEQSTMYMFHVTSSLCIGASLHTIVVFSLMNYRTNRFIGFGLIDQSAEFVENTATYRTQARFSFALGLFLFVSSLCVLYFDGLPSELAITNTLILSITICFVVHSVWNIFTVSAKRNVSAKKKASETVDKESIGLLQ